MFRSNTCSAPRNTSSTNLHNPKRFAEPFSKSHERLETWVTLSTGHMGHTFRPLRREVPMPWKETSPVEERLSFVARLLEGEAMAALCREFCISRKTGYKIFERYKE